MVDPNDTRNLINKSPIPGDSLPRQPPPGFDLEEKRREARAMVSIPLCGTPARGSIRGRRHRRRGEAVTGSPVIGSRWRSAGYRVRSGAVTGSRGLQFIITPPFLEKRKTETRMENLERRTWQILLLSVAAGEVGGRGGKMEVDLPPKHLRKWLPMVKRGGKRGPGGSNNSESGKGINCCPFF